MVYTCDFFCFTKHFFYVEYSDTVVKLTENRDRNVPAFNAYDIVINLNL